MQHVTVKIAFALLIVMLIGTFHVWSPTAHAASNTFKITSIYTADANDNQKGSFNQDDPIHFIVLINNFSGSTITALFHVEAYYVLKDHSRSQTIFDKIVDNVSIPPGNQGYRAVATVPDNTFTGTFEYHVRVYNDNNYPNDYDFKDTTFSTTGVLDVPYASQFQNNPPGTQPSYKEDCGPTSVAMALNFYGKGPGIDGKGIEAVRNTISNHDQNTMGPTNADELEYAISQYGDTTSPIDANEVPNASAAIPLIGQIVLLGNPVIAYIDAHKLNPPRNYTHFLLVVGVSHDQSKIYVDDPDSDFLPGEASTISSSDFAAALQSGQSDGQPYGIIVG